MYILTLASCHFQLAQWKTLATVTIVSLPNTAEVSLFQGERPQAASGLCLAQRGSSHGNSKAKSNLTDPQRLCAAVQHGVWISHHLTPAWDQLTQQKWANFDQ